MSDWEEISDQRVAELRAISRHCQRPPQMHPYRRLMARLKASLRLWLREVPSHQSDESGGLRAGFDRVLERGRQYIVARSERVDLGLQPVELLRQVRVSHAYSFREGLRK